MITTEDYIQLLKDNSIEEINKLPSTSELQKCLDFQRIYDEINKLSNPSIHYILGYMYQYGLILNQNYETAIHYYKLATAEVPHGQSLCRIARLYQYGKSVEQNDEQCVHFYQLSIAAGNKVAMTNLGRRYIDGQGVTKDYEMAEYYLNMAIEKGSAVALYNKGCIYSKKMNYEKSYYYFYLAYKQGDKDAYPNMLRLQNSITPSFMIDHFDERAKHSEEINELKQEIKDLKAENLELRFKPGGVGYDAAKQDFDSML